MKKAQLATAVAIGLCGTPYPALAELQAPPDVTLLCTMTVHGPDRVLTQQKLIEVWYQAGQVVIDHGEVMPAKIDDRSIKIVMNSSAYGYSWQHVYVIDRTTGFFSLSGTTTDPFGSVPPGSGQCSRAPSKQLF